MLEIIQVVMREIYQYSEEGSGHIMTILINQKESKIQIIIDKPYILTFIMHGFASLSK